MGCGSSTQIESRQATLERRRASAARVPTPPVDDGLLAVASTVVIIDYDDAPPPAAHTFDAAAQPSQSSLRPSESTTSLGAGGSKKNGRRSITFRAVDGSTTRLARSPLPPGVAGTGNGGDNGESGRERGATSPTAIARQLEEADRLSRLAGDLGFGVVVSPKATLKSPLGRFAPGAPSPPESTPTVGGGGRSFESELTTRDTTGPPVTPSRSTNNDDAAGGGLEDAPLHPMESWVHRSNSTATGGSDDEGDGGAPAAASANENRSSNALNRSGVHVAMEDNSAIAALGNRRHLEPPPVGGVQ